MLIVGLGGLGSPLALYLAGAGVGTLWLADGDTVDSSNLPRQILFDVDAVNHSKAELARERLAAHNPLVELIAINQRLDAASLPEFVAEVDLVIDCCDNLATRQAINAACVAQGKPWISAAAVGWQGQRWRVPAAIMPATPASIRSIPRSRRAARPAASPARWWG